MMSYVDPSSDCSPSSLISLVQQYSLFDSDDAPELAGKWPSLLQSMLTDRKIPNPNYSCCLSSLALSVAYLNRCCVANLLMSQRLFYLIDNIDQGIQLVSYSLSRKRHVT